MIKQYSKNKNVCNDKKVRLKIILVIDVFVTYKQTFNKKSKKSQHQTIFKKPEKNEEKVENEHRLPKDEKNQDSKAGTITRAGAVWQEKHYRLHKMTLI